MKRLVLIAVTGFVIVAARCGQGTGNTSSGSTEPTTSPGSPGATSAEQTSSFYRIPVSSHHGVLECADRSTNGAVYDHAKGIGEKASPGEQTRRRFSRRIEEDDKVEIADDLGGPNKGYYGEELKTVRVLRDGRVVAPCSTRRVSKAEGAGPWVNM
jgi:hypothetical protein